MDRCVNCGIATSRCNTLVRRALDDVTILSVIRHWRAPQPVNSSDYVCQACWNLAQESSVEAQQLGHRSVCLRCGCSLATRLSHLLKTDSPRELRIYNVIQEQIMPRTIVEVTSCICHKCWVAADRAATHMASGPSTSSQGSSREDVQPQAQVLPTESPNKEVRNNHSEPTIVLPNYKRAIETESRCFIEGCQRSERYRVPVSTRKMLLSQYKYYIPENNRLCDRHLDTEAWDFLDSLRNNYVQTFTAKHIQDMMSLKDVVGTRL